MVCVLCKRSTTKVRCEDVKLLAGTAFLFVSGRAFHFFLIYLLNDIEKSKKFKKMIDKRILNNIYFKS